MNNPLIRNIIAVIVGGFVGGMVNMGIIMLGHAIVGLPDGVTMENLLDNFHLLEFKDFIFPLLAHAIGTLVGAFIVTKLAVSHHLKLSMLVGALFFYGGISMVIQYGGPLWFKVLDLAVAYFPMAWLGHKLAHK